MNTTNMKKIIEIKRKKLVVHFGFDPALYKQSECSKFVECSNQHVTSLDPIPIYDNRLLSSSNRKLLRPVEFLVFRSNNFFNFDESFRLDLLFPNLVHLISNESTICCHIVRLSREKRLRFPKIKCLDLPCLSMDVIRNSFPNLVCLRVKVFGLEYVSRFPNMGELKLKCLTLVEDKLTNPFIDLLVSSFKRLEYLKVNIMESAKIVFLNRILKELNRIKEINLFVHGSTYGISQLLNKHQHLFLNNNKFSLTINFVKVQSNLQHLEPIYNSNELEEFKGFEIKQLERDERTNLNRDEYYGKIERFTASRSQIVQLRTCSRKLRNLEVLTVCRDKVDFDLNELIELSPKTLKMVAFNFRQETSQAILDSIPDKFPYLAKITLSNLGDKSYDLKFLSKAIYLSQLYLIDISFVDVEHLIDAVRNCRFLALIHVNYDSKSSLAFDKCKPKLLNEIELKKKQNKSINYEIKFN